MLHFNDGVTGMAEVFKKLGIEFGIFPQQGALDIDMETVELMQKKEGQEFKNARKRKRGRGILC